MNKKVLLTVPFYPYRNSHPLIPDLGLGYLASALRRKGHDVQLIDWNNRSNVQHLHSQIKDFQPDVVGIKFFTLNTAAAKKTVSLIKKSLPKQPFIIIGGPHPSGEEKKWLIKDFPEANARYVGEAEEIFPQFVMELPDNLVQTSSPPLQGIDLLSENTFSAEISLIKELDSLAPPAWNMIDPRLYPAFTIDGKKRVLAPLMATRGCPMKCKFCSIDKISGTNIRNHSPEYLIEQIKYLADNYDVSALTFLDTNFMTKVNWLDQMLEKLLQLDRNIVWNCVWGIAPSKIDKPILQKMYKAGCRAIIMGIESGSDSVKTQFAKRESAAKTREMINQIKETGINVHGFFMVGFPNEKKEQMKETRRFSLSLPLEVFSFSICFPLPGTDCYEWLKKKYSIEHIDWEHFDIYSSPFPMSQLSSAELARFRRLGQLRNLLRPKKFLADVRRGMFNKEVWQSFLKKLLRRFLKKIT